MSVNTETGSAQGQTTCLTQESVYASLFDKINLTPASSLGDINAFLDDAALSDTPAGERLTAAMQVFMDCIRKSGQQVEKLDKTLIDHHIAELDYRKWRRDPLQARFFSTLNAGEELWELILFLHLAGRGADGSGALCRCTAGADVWQNVAGKQSVRDE